MKRRLECGHLETKYIYTLRDNKGTDIGCQCSRCYNEQHKWLDGVIKLHRENVVVERM